MSRKINKPTNKQTNHKTISNPQFNPQWPGTSDLLLTTKKDTATAAAKHSFGIEWMSMYNVLGTRVHRQRENKQNNVRFTSRYRHGQQLTWDLSNWPLKEETTMWLNNVNEWYVNEWYANVHYTKFTHYSLLITVMQNSLCAGETALRTTQLYKG